MADSSIQFAGASILDSQNDRVSLISWATGNCYNNIPNTDDSIVNDCYAEVLCRRGLLM